MIPKAKGNITAKTIVERQGVNEKSIAKLIEAARNNNRIVPKPPKP